MLLDAPFYHSQVGSLDQGPQVDIAMKRSIDPDIYDVVTFFLFDSGSCPRPSAQYLAEFILTSHRPAKRAEQKHHDNKHSYQSSAQCQTSLHPIRFQL